MKEESVSRKRIRTIIHVVIKIKIQRLICRLLVAGLDLVIGPDSGMLAGLHTGLFMSVVWVFTSIAVTHLFVGRTFRLILIDAGFYVVFFSLAGLILDAW
jgi:hypothetical protein